MPNTPIYFEEWQQSQWFFCYPVGKRWRHPQWRSFWLFHTCKHSSLPKTFVLLVSNELSIASWHGARSLKRTDLLLKDRLELVFLQAGNNHPAINGSAVKAGQDSCLSAEYVIDQEEC